MQSVRHEWQNALNCIVKMYPEFDQNIHVSILNYNRFLLQIFNPGKSVGEGAWRKGGARRERGGRKGCEEGYGGCEEDELNEEIEIE